MQLIQWSLLLSALYMFREGFSAHHQELTKLYVQPWVLSCFPAVYPLLFYKLLMMGGKTA
jgi:hypothetical protein